MYVSVALLLKGIAASWKKLKQIQIALRWGGLKAKSAVRSLTIALICAFSRRGKMPYQASP